MAKNLMINKFYVKYDGIRYGVDSENGNVIRNVPDELAQKLIADSRGNIFALPSSEPVSDNAQPPETDSSDTRPPNIQPPETDSSDTRPPIDPKAKRQTELPPIDPKATMRK